MNARSRPVALALAVALLLPAPLQAQEASIPRIGVAAPLSGSNAILGEQLVSGARAALPEGDDILVTADTACSPEGGLEAARRLQAERVTVVLGFLCTEALEAALPVLAEAGIPVLGVGVRSARILSERERNGWPLFQLAPKAEDAAIAIADLMEERWRGEPFGLIEDGSIANRALIDDLRRRLEERNMPPQVMDNFRPAEDRQFGLARRLARTGVTRFFIAGDRPDIAVIARDAAESGLELDLIASEALVDEPSADFPLRAGVLTVAPRPVFPSLRDGPAPDDQREAALRSPGSYHGPAYAAGEIALQALREAAGSERSLTAVLEETRFETELGPVSFDTSGSSTLDLFTTLEWDGEAFLTPGGVASGTGG